MHIFHASLSCFALGKAALHLTPQNAHITHNSCLMRSSSAASSWTSSSCLCFSSSPCRTRSSSARRFCSVTSKDNVHFFLHYLLPLAAHGNMTCNSKHMCVLCVFVRYVHVSMNVCMCVLLCMYTYVCTCVCVCKACMYVSVSRHVPVCMQVPVCMYVCVCVYVSVHMCVCVYR